MIDAIPSVRQMETHNTTPPSQQIPAVIDDTVDNASHDECYNDDAIHKSSSIEIQILPKAFLKIVRKMSQYRLSQVKTWKVSFEPPPLLRKTRLFNVWHSCTRKRGYLLAL